MTVQSSQIDNREELTIDTGVDFERVWNGISGRMWATEPGAFERFFAHVLRSPVLARAIVATPSLYIAWTMASVIVFAIGAWMTQSTEQPIVPMLAPVVAGIGVSLAYGSGADPAWEITRSTALPERLLLLVRVVVVFATNTVVGLIVTLVTDRSSDITFLWLLPMASVALVGLAIAIVSDSPAVGSASAIGIWICFVVTTFIETRQAARVIEESRIVDALPLYGLLAVMSCVAIWFLTGDMRLKGFRR